MLAFSLPAKRASERVEIWRKLKRVALVRLRSGTIRRAELHWYEAYGIGRKEIKRKRYVDETS